MTNHRYPLLAFLAVAALILGCSQTEGPGDDDPNSNPASGNAGVEASGEANVAPIEGKSLTEALVLADSAGKNLLVEYWDPDCPWCKKMDGQTLSDSSVKAALDNVLHVRMEKGKTGESFEARWGEVGTPSYVVVKPDGSVPGNVVTGLVAKQDFLAYLNWAESANGPEPKLASGGS